MYTKGSEQVTVKPKLSSGDKVKVAAQQTQGGISKSGARETPREKPSKKLCSELCPIQELFTQPRDLPDPEIEPRSPTLQADSLPTKPPGKVE